MPILYWSINGYYISVDMIIGFHQRSQTIPESDVVLSLDVHSSILSELDYEVQFHIWKRSRSTFNGLNDQFDVQFVNWDNHSDPLKFSSTLINGSLDLAALPQIRVQNDSFIEAEECYTVTILSPDGVESFTCRIEDNSTDFFCLHTICIADDDG